MQTCYQVGIDEVGRGAWAGPVVAAAVILPSGLSLPEVRDSKVMTPPARARANRLIRAAAEAIGIGWVAAAEVDTHGLSWAVQQSGLRALAALEAAAGITPQHLHVTLDGTHNYLAGTAYSSQAVIKADALVPSVSAASIIAKVARDNYLARLDHCHPGYGFAAHKGYGTAAHQAALAVLGACPQHRRSYRPVARIITAPGAAA